ncbi:MAG TPA: hypothetical protein VGH02_08895 [Rhizomicrobium sp.]|jgi:hypothetical protein
MKSTTLILAGAFSLIALQANAADVRGEIINANEHAEYAAEATDLKGLHMHLHHTLNCLVGPSGVGFDAKELNPCAGSGSGIIPDTADPAKKKPFQAAAEKAKAGLAENDFAKAKKIAVDLSAMLKPLE